MKPTPEEIAKTIGNLFVDMCGLNECEYQDAKISELPLDSLDHVELIMAFEEEYAVELPEEMEDGLKTRTVKEAAEYLHSTLDWK